MEDQKAVRRQVSSDLSGPPAGLIIRQKEPTNLEMPFDQVDSYRSAHNAGASCTCPVSDMEPLHTGHVAVE